MPIRQINKWISLDIDVVTKKTMLVVNNETTYLTTDEWAHLVNELIDAEIIKFHTGFINGD